MPKHYTRAMLKALPATKLDVFAFAGPTGPISASFTGVLLWDLLTDAVVRTDPAIKNDILRKELTVIGSDGYVAAFSLGELDPMFGGEQVIVAYEENGKPISGTDGFARVVVPGDKAAGRYVFSVAKITVGPAP